MLSVSPQNLAVPPKPFSLFRTASKRLRKILKRDYNHPRVFGKSSLFGQQRSADDVRGLVGSLKSVGLDTGIIQRGLSHLDIRSSRDAIKALVKGEHGYEHPFVPQEEGNPALCEICRCLQSDHALGGDWKAYQKKREYAWNLDSEREGYGDQTALRVIKVCVSKDHEDFQDLELEHKLDRLTSKSSFPFRPSLSFRRDTTQRYPRIQSGKVILNQR